MPIGMDALGMYGAPVDYLSLKELEGRKKELTARFNELNSSVGDGERQIKERKDKAELFESLYQEGVVSRRELEAAKREAGEIDRDLKFKLDEFESVKISMKAVNNRLAMLKKQEEKMNSSKKNSKAVAKKK
jgi:multidrug resistance efflux pump